MGSGPEQGGPGEGGGRRGRDGEREEEGEGARGHKDARAAKVPANCTRISLFSEHARGDRDCQHIRAQRNRCGGGRNPATSAVKAKNRPGKQAFEEQAFPRSSRAPNRSDRWWSYTWSWSFSWPWPRIASSPNGTGWSVPRTCVTRFDLSSANGNRLEGERRES